MCGDSEEKRISIISHPIHGFNCCHLWNEVALQRWISSGTESSVRTLLHIAIGSFPSHSSTVLAGEMWCDEFSATNLPGIQTEVPRKSVFHSLCNVNGTVKKVSGSAMRSGTCTTKIGQMRLCLHHGATGSSLSCKHQKLTLDYWSWRIICW